jgi:MYXO-CTERM domain-containing protein
LGLGNWMIRANAVPTPGAAGLLALAGLAATRRRR